jgi:hypothetical protein
MHHPLGTLLLQEHMLKEEDLERVERICEEQRCSFEDAVTRLGLLTPETLAVFKEHLPTLAPGELLEVDPTLIPKVPPAVAQRFSCIPVSHFGGTLTLAVPDPQDEKTLTQVREAVGCPVDAVPGLESDLRQAVQYHYGDTGEDEAGAGAPEPALEVEPAREAVQEAVQEATAGGTGMNDEVGAAAEEQIEALIREKRKRPAPPAAVVEEAPPAAAETGEAAGPAKEAPRLSVVGDAPPAGEEEDAGEAPEDEAVPGPEGEVAEAAPEPVSEEDVEVLVEDLESPPPQVRLAHSFLGRMVARGAQRLELRWKRDQPGEAVLHAGKEREHLMAVPTGQMPLVIQRYRVLGDMLLQSRKKPQKGTFQVKVQLGGRGRKSREDRKFLITIVPIGDLEGEVATLAPAATAAVAQPEAPTPTEAPATRCPACGAEEVLERFKYCPMCGVGVG